MRTLFYLGILSLAVLLLSSCQRNTVWYMATKVEQKPLVDGALNDWQTPLIQPSSQVDIRFRSAYDQEYLYIVVHIPDAYYRSLMLANGGSIWLDTLAKRRDKFGIGYPLALNNAQLEAIAIESQGDERQFFDNYAKALQEFDLIGFVEEPVRASNLSSNSIKVAAQFDELQALIYELKIPLNQIFNRVPTPGTSMSIGIEVNTPKTSPLDEQDDSSLFNDRNMQNNGITQSNPLMGPNMNPRAPQNQNMGSRQPSMPVVWAKIQLDSLP